MDEDNDGRFPDDSPIEIRYPRSKAEEQGDRATEVVVVAVGGSRQWSVTCTSMTWGGCTASAQLLFAYTGFLSVQRQVLAPALVPRRSAQPS